MKIQSFTDLHGWQEGHKLVIKVYNISKEKFLELANDSVVVSKLVNGLIKSSKILNT